MLLKDLLVSTEHVCVRGDTNIKISDIAYDSRTAIKGSLFVCLKGSDTDGHKFVGKAIENGARAVVASEIVETNGWPLILVPDTRVALAEISAEFFKKPAFELKTIGITGTKGKTTTSCMIRSILQKAGIKSGLIGTLGIVIDNEVIKTINTTPESYDIQKYLRLMVEKGCKCAIIEVSSLGLKSHRTDGIVFDYGVFTNFSSDHIGKNEHETMEEYLACKSLLFKQCKWGLINIDDKNCEGVLFGRTCKIETFGFSNNADLVAENEQLVLENGYLGVKFDLSGNLNLTVFVDIPGKFSVYNALSSIAVCRHFNVSEQAILDGLNEVKVKGRIETLKVPGNYTLLIDYAHNALSMENVLTTLRAYKPNRLITLFGAGGNRPKIRRLEMGEVSGKLSDLSVITADNSRDEDVLNIIKDIEEGLKKVNGEYIVIPDRREAIKYCIKTAQDGDIIVLAGKGHEDYQEILGQRLHFSDVEHAQQALHLRRQQHAGGVA